MKTLIFTTLMLISMAVFSSNDSANYNINLTMSASETYFDVEKLQKLEAEEAIPEYVKPSVMKENKLSEVNESLLCLINQIGQREAEEELPEFLM